MKHDPRPDVTAFACCIHSRVQAQGRGPRSFECSTGRLRNVGAAQCRWLWAQAGRVRWPAQQWLHQSAGKRQRAWVVEVLGSWLTAMSCHKLVQLVVGSRNVCAPGILQLLTGACCCDAALLCMAVLTASGAGLWWGPDCHFEWRRHQRHTGRIHCDCAGQQYTHCARHQVCQKQGQERRRVWYVVVPAFGTASHICGQHRRG